jgi:hypothetical protein
LALAFTRLNHVISIEQIRMAAAASASAYEDDKALAFSGCGFKVRDAMPIAENAFAVSTDDSVILAFRGTINVHDWLLDLDARFISRSGYPGKVHQGFYSATVGLRGKVENAITALRDNGQQLIFTGHSLGGAMAVLSAIDNDWQPNEGGLKLITFGQPRVGNGTFAKQSSGILLRPVLNICGWLIRATSFRGCR